MSEVGGQKCQRLRSPLILVSMPGFLPCQEMKFCKQVEEKVRAKERQRENEREAKRKKAKERRREKIKIEPVQGSTGCCSIGAVCEVSSPSLLSFSLPLSPILLLPSSVPS